MGFLDYFTPTIRTAATPESVDVAAASVAPYYSETANIFFSGIVSATRAEAMSVPTVARCLGVMQTIGSLPLHVRNVATGEKVQAPRVINQPDPRIPGATYCKRFILPPCRLCLCNRTLCRHRKNSLNGKNCTRARIC